MGKTSLLLGLWQTLDCSHTWDGWEEAGIQASSKPNTGWGALEH